MIRKGGCGLGGGGCCRGRGKLQRGREGVCGPVSCDKEGEE